MINNNLKAIVTDLDGTLLNSQKKCSDRDYSTLISLGKQNILRIIATGRSIYSTSKVIPKDFPVDYLIFNAGGGIMNFKTKEILISHFHKKEESRKIAEKLIKLKLDFQIRKKAPEGHKYLSKRFFKSNPDFDRLDEIYSDFKEELTNFDQINEAGRIISIAPNYIETEDIIRNEFPEFSIIRASSPIDNSSVWMEIFPKGINKGSALNYLGDKLNFSASENVLGLGNDFNDIDFLDICSISLITANAHQNLKKKYKVTSSNDENPLTESIKFLKNGRNNQFSKL